VVTRVLAVGAHPDDAELGCGGTLALSKERGYEVYVLMLTRGEAGGDPNIREKEGEQAARMLGVNEVFFGSLQDTKVNDGIETITQIEGTISSLKPDIVFAPSPKDQHQDHRNTGLATLSAARNVKKVLLYESPAAFRDFCPQVFVDIDATFEIKLKALNVFASQSSKRPFSRISSHANSSQVVHASEGLARFRGFQAGVAVAEAFEVGKFLFDI
jgi:LmbE family N-acetylglucosaminyl deacetylase